MSSAQPAIRTFQPSEPSIARATDLGGVDVLKQGNLYLITDPFGDIHPDSRGLGLYAGETRILSCSVLRIDGFRPTVLRGDSGEGFRGTIQLTNPEERRDPADKIRKGRALARQTLAMTRHRLVGAGLSERLIIANFTEHAVSLSIELTLGVDSADIFEVRGYHRPQRGRYGPVAIDERHVAFGYQGLDGFLRRTFVSFPTAEVEPANDGIAGGSVLVRWRREVTPGTQTEVEWIVWGTDDEAPGAVPPAVDTFPDPPPMSEADGVAAYAAWTEGSTLIQSDNQLFDRLVARGLTDLQLLMNDGPDPGERYVAAGVPWFATLFGRDALVTAYEAMAVRPSLAVETLQVLAAHQATVNDPEHDAEPGKIPHELRTGEMARTGELPFGAYYGSVDSTPLWLVLLGETFDWTGDRALVDRLWPNALAALEWIDRSGDLDGDGFVEYRRRSKRGLINQGWKDSSDAVRDREGNPVEPPIALAEVQGYVFDAKRRLARLARLRGETDLADRLEADAALLKKRFDEAFWMPDQGAYAMALDRDKKPADALTSNQGQALWSGIVDTRRARAVVDCLTGPGLHSGWGIRTYAAGQPGYNPLSYHVGSIWPHDNALILAGLKAYGFDAEANALAGQLFEVAQHFPDFRMPELFCGFDRASVGVPVPYPVACSPQAWAAAAPMLIIRSMLGLRARASEGVLELVRPHLPTWLGKLTVSNLRVGNASVDLLVHRWRGTTSAEVLRKVGDLEVTIRV
jgi:glycogen debranching enzyme